MVKSSENFLKRGRRSRPNVTRDEVLTCGSSRRSLTRTFTTADHAGISGVYPTEGRGSSVQAGLALGQQVNTMKPGIMTFHITFECLLPARAQTGRRP